MAYARNRKRRRGSNWPDRGLSFKSPRTPVAAYRYAVTPKKVILTVIFVAVFVVIIATICSILLNPERLVPKKSEALARDYYEFYFYEGMLNSENYSGNPEKALSEYQQTGIAPQTLRSLYLLDKENDNAKYLLKYCDGDETVFRFFPEPPYARNSYRVDYTYSCNY